jgi:hypothetical protein
LDKEIIMKWKLIRFVDGFIYCLQSFQYWIEVVADNESFLSVPHYYFWRFLGEEQ